MKYYRKTIFAKAFKVFGRHVFLICYKIMNIFFTNKVCPFATISFIYFSSDCVIYVSYAARRKIYRIKV